MATPQIPNAGAYLEQITKGKNAYDRAVAALKAQRAQRQVASGLLDDWSVDPRAQYGAYQAMLQGQGFDLDRALESSNQRGLFGGGLANQPESMLRYGQAVQTLGFKNQLQDWEREYAGGMAEAKRQQELEALAAMQGAYGDAVSEGDWGYPSAPSDSWNYPYAVPPIPTGSARGAPLLRSGNYRPQGSTQQQRRNQTQNPYAFRPSTVQGRPRGGSY